MRLVKFNANGGVAMEHLTGHRAIRRLVFGGHVPGVGMALVIVVYRKARLMAMGIIAFGVKKVFNAGCVPTRRVIVAFSVMFGQQR